MRLRILNSQNHPRFTHAIFQLASAPPVFAEIGRIFIANTQSPLYHFFIVNIYVITYFLLKILEFILQISIYFNDLSSMKRSYKRFMREAHVIVSMQTI